MDDRSDLAIRADVLNKLADQLSEQLAVERRANDELRSLLRDGPTVSLPRDPGAGFVPIVATLAGVAMAVTICLGVAASWTRAGGCPAACPARFTAAVSAAVPAPAPALALTPALAPANAVGLRALGPPVLGPPAQVPAPPAPSATSNPRDCGPIANVGAARCFVAATGGSASGEYMLRNLILAHTLLGERGRARVLASRYFTEFESSPFTRQIRQLGY